MPSCTEQSKTFWAFFSCDTKTAYRDTKHNKLEFLWETITSSYHAETVLAFTSYYKTKNKSNLGFKLKMNQEKTMSLRIYFWIYKILY